MMIRSLRAFAVLFLLAAATPTFAQFDVSVTKGGPSSAVAQAIVIYNITVSNTGPADAPTVTLTDVLPGDMTFVQLQQMSGPAFSCTTPAPGSGGTVSCTIALLTATSATFELRTQIPAGTPAGTSYDNTATVTSAAGDVDGTNNSDTSSLDVTPTADLGISKFGPATALPDTDVSFDVTVFNAGPDTANTQFIDTMPPGLTFVSITQNSGPAFGCTDPGTGNNGPITCTNNAFASGGNANFTIVMHVPPAVQPGTDFTNSTSVTSGDAFDPTTENNSSSTSFTVQPNDADVAVQKAGPNVAAPGANVTYTITVSNAGPIDAQNVALSDTLPGTMTFVSITQDSGPVFNCTTPAAGAGGTITCSISAFPVGSAATFSLTGNIPNATPSGTQFSNTATVESDFDPNPDNNSSTVELTVANADLMVTKTGPGTVTAGQTITYPITVTNNGPDTAGNVRFDDILPPGTTLSSFTQNTGPTFSCGGPTAGNTGTVECTINALGSGATATFTLVLNVSPNFADGGTLTNTATVLSDTGDANQNNNTASTSATVAGLTDVGVTKSGPLSANAGTNLTYTITVQNFGPNPAQNTQLTDNIPAGTTFVSFVQNSGPVFNCSGTTSISCSNASFAAGTTATFTLIVGVPANGTGPVSNTAHVATTTIDTNGGNDNSTVNTTITQQADVSVVKNGPATAAVATNVTYNITVTNNGPSNAANVSLNDSVPAQTTFVSFGQGGGPAFSCSGTTTINCTIASLAPGTPQTFTLVVAVANNASGTITNTATVNTTTTDPNAGNDTSTVNTAITQQADLSVTKSGPPTAAVGSDISYTIGVANAGPSAASTVSLTDTLPAGTTFASIQQNNGPVFNCSGTTTVTCTIATFASGASAAFTLTVHVTANGNLTNTATIGSATNDPATGNNSASANTTASTVDLSLTKSVTPGPYIVGMPVTFTLTVMNNGTIAATNVVVTDPLPGGMSATATTPPGACTGTTTVTCTAATLAAGASTSFTITANLPALPGNYTNTATVSSATTEATPGNNSGSAAFAVLPAQAIPMLSPGVLALLAALLGIVGIIAMKR